MCEKRREYYTNRKVEYKCPNSDCYAAGISMKFRVSEILECPAHLVATRLARKKRCQEELNDRASGESVCKQSSVPLNQDLRHGDNPEIRSISSESSDLVMPHLKQAFSDEEDGRAPPIPTPPNYETLTWAEPHPKATAADIAKKDMKQQDLHLFHLVSSRRGSLVGESTRPILLVAQLLAWFQWEEILRYRPTDSPVGLLPYRLRTQLLQVKFIAMILHALTFRY